jgi:hypothetical protein
VGSAAAHPSLLDFKDRCLALTLIAGAEAVSKRPLTHKGAWSPAALRSAMLDLIFVAATALFFAAGILYVHACERLK